MNHEDQKENGPEMENEEKVSRYGVKKVVFIIILILLFLFVGIVVGLGGFITNALKPVETANEPIEIIIEPGTNSAGISVLLEEHNLIRSETVFRYYLRYKNQGH